MPDARGLRVLVTTAIEADRRRAVSVLALAAANGLLQIVPALGLKWLIEGAAGGDLGQVSVVAVAIAFSVGLLAVSNATLGNLTSVLQQKTGLLVDTRLMELSVGAAELGHYERAEHFDTVATLRDQRGAYGKSIPALASGVQITILVLASLAAMASVHPLLPLLGAFAVPSIVATAKGASLREAAVKESAEVLRQADYVFALGTSPHAGGEMRALGAANELVERHRRNWELVEDVRQRADLRAALVSTGGWLAYAIGYIAARVVVVLLAVQNPTAATVGDVIMVFNLSRQMNLLVGSAVATLSWLWESLNTVARFEGLVKVLRPAATGPAEAATVPSRLMAGVRFENVSFSYPGSDREVLRGVNLHINPGSTVAVVGENGAGKSTLVKLLCGFYTPTAGRITVDGTDLTRFRPAEWRARTSACFQDFVRFELLLRDCVGIGDLSRAADDDAIIAAVERANARELVDSLPDRLESQLGRSFERGTELSAGQWQKLALARSLMRDDPLVLILDEPTASIDAETERVLFEHDTASVAAASKRSGAITFVVSHGHRIAAQADQVVLLRAGKVVDAGSSEEVERRRSAVAWRQSSSRAEA